MFSRFIFNISVLTLVGLDFTVLISDCPDVDLLCLRFLFTWYSFSSVLFVCYWLISFSFVSSVVLLLFSVSVFSLCVWSANSGPCFKFSSACSPNILITYSSSYSFSDVVPLRVSTGKIGELYSVIVTADMLFCNIKMC